MDPVIFFLLRIVGFACVEPDCDHVPNFPSGQFEGRVRPLAALPGLVIAGFLGGGRASFLAGFLQPGYAGEDHGPLRHLFCALIPADRLHWDEPFRERKIHILPSFPGETSIFEFLLVVFSYLLVIDGRIMPIGNNFIEPLISIDGFYIQQLHLFFFVFILTQYFGSAYFLWYGRPGAVGFAGCVLIVFYLFAEPDCLGMLKKQNTYQKLGYDVSQMMLDADKAYGEKLSYTIYISDGIYVDDRKDFSWSLYIRNLECPWQIVKYPAEDKPKLGDEKGFVIYKLGETQLPRIRRST
jgi:hypothetical protein